MKRGPRLLEARFGRLCRAEDANDPGGGESSPALAPGELVEVVRPSGERVYSGTLVSLDGRWAHVRVDEHSADAGSVTAAPLERVRRLDPEGSNAA